MSFLHVTLHLQVSGDEQRRLCSAQKYGASESGLGLAMTLTTYGSVAYQLKDAHLEASSTCDFVCKALSIVNKTGKCHSENCLFASNEIAHVSDDCDD